MVGTDAGELFTFGYGNLRQLGHGGYQNELVPRLIRALSGKKVVSAEAGSDHTAVWTEEGELFTFGSGGFGPLGHAGNRMSLCRAGRGAGGEEGGWRSSK